MKRRLRSFFACLILALLGACAVMPTASNLGQAYPLLYDSSPKTVLILPPQNNSTAADAREYFACSLGEALGLNGYYPLPVQTVFDILGEEGWYDIEPVNPAVLQRMKEFLGADAVLITTIQTWDKSWAILGGALSIRVDYLLLDAASADVLWDFTTTVNVSLDSESKNLLAVALETALKTATEDYFENARMANLKTMGLYLPKGPYHPEHGMDAENQLPWDKKAVFDLHK